MPQKILHRRAKRHSAIDSMTAAGRWSLLWPSRLDSTNNQEAVEHIARTLLLRYGVVFRKVLAREDGIPSWRELLYVYRRLEARGEIRGGRFVQSFSGEQFALPEAVILLKEIRKHAKTDEVAKISAVDPLNLSGIITPGERVSPVCNQRIAYKNGVPIIKSQFESAVDFPIATQDKSLLFSKIN